MVRQRFFLAATIITLAIHSMAAPITELKIRNIAKGGFSGITESSRQVMTNQTAWLKFWGRHSVRNVPPPNAPEIDFEKETILAVTMGQKNSGGYVIEIIRVEKGEDHVTVTVAQRSPPPGSFGLAALTAPFHIVAIPKTSVKVEFKEAGAENSSSPAKP